MHRRGINMKNDVFDVLIMQKKTSEDLVSNLDEQISKEEKFNYEAQKYLEETKMQTKNNLEFLKNIGIFLDDELEKCHKEVEEETKAILKEIDSHITEHKSSIITYDQLVKKAHAVGYINTQLEELLTEKEIQECDAEYERIEKEFEVETKLQKKDINFLMIAIALQAVRQYILDPLLKERRKNASHNDEANHENKSPGWYRVETEEILTNTVPFDAVRYSNYETVKDFLKGQKNHREATLGHDPILGWIFGTANIMTGTITNTAFASAHVKYIPGSGNIIYSRADTEKIFSTVYDRIMNEGFDGKLALAYALIREGIHLKSDIGTTHSLPLPGINVLSPELGNKLAKYGINVASVGTEASLSVLINFLISIIHGMLKAENEDEKLYAVRTRKILLISNTIASTSNVLAVGIATGIGTVMKKPNMVKKSVSYLDVGGLLVTISRLFTDIHFINDIKEEYIDSKINEQLQEELDRLDLYLD